MQKQRLMWVAWPAFLAAAMMEMLVFAAFDPHDMLWLGQGLEMSRSAIYTCAFFAFWLVFMAAGFLTVLLTTPAQEVNGQALIP